MDTGWMIFWMKFRDKGVNVYDVNPMTPGVGADLSHIDTKARVESFVGDEVEAAVAGCDIVLIPAGVPRKPG